MGAYSASPDLLVVFRKPIFKGREGKKGDGRGWKERGEERREKAGREEDKGRERGELVKGRREARSRGEDGFVLCPRKKKKSAHMALADFERDPRSSDSMRGSRNFLSSK